MDASPTALHGSPWYPLLALLIVATNAFFVAAEYALVRVRPARLRELAREGSSGAARALQLVTHFDKTLSVCQIGVTLTSLALGWVGEPAFAALFARILAPASPWLGPLALSTSLALAFFLITLLHVILGELVPKSLAIRFAERWSIALSLPLRMFSWLAWPLVAFINWLSSFVLRVFKPADLTESAAHSADEIRHLVVRSMQQGEIAPVEARLFDNLLRFADRRTRDVMVPRSRVAAIDLRAPRDRIAQRVRDEGYSRYPVIDGDLDRTIGIVHVKDLLPALAQPGDTRDLRALARPAQIVPDLLPLDRLLASLQSHRAHMALVADEYGGIVGIVTLEDVLEELVGELRDEFDTEEQDPVRPRAGGGYLLDPLLPLDRAAELVPDPPPLPKEVTTLAGFLQAELGRLPQSGDRVPFGAAHDLVASAVQGTRMIEISLVPTTR